MHLFWQISTCTWSKTNRYVKKHSNYLNSQLTSAINFFMQCFQCVVGFKLQTWVSLIHGCSNKILFYFKFYLTHSNVLVKLLVYESQFAWYLWYQGQSQSQSKDWLFHRQRHLETPCGSSGRDGEIQNGGPANRWRRRTWHCHVSVLLLCVVFCSCDQYEVLLFHHSLSPLVVLGYVFMISIVDHSLFFST